MGAAPPIAISTNTAQSLHTRAAMADNLLMYAKLGYVESGHESRDGFDRMLFVKRF